VGGNSDAGSGRPRWLIPALVLGGISLIVVALRELAPLMPAFANWVDGLGPLAPLLFIAGYVVGTILLLPGAVFSMVGGTVFGVLWGTVLAVAAALIAMIAAFLISRYVVRDAISRRLSKHPDLVAIDKAVGKDGFRIVLLLRLSPVFPFSVVNYALGLTRVRFRDYLAASVGIIPATLVFVTAGRLVGDLAMVAAGEASPDSTGSIILLVLAAVATLTVVIVVTRLARKALREATGVGGE